MLRGASSGSSRFFSSWLLPSIIFQILPARILLKLVTFYYSYKYFRLIRFFHPDVIWVRKSYIISDLCSGNIVSWMKILLFWREKIYYNNNNRTTGPLPWFSLFDPEILSIIYYCVQSRDIIWWYYNVHKQELRYEHLMVLPILWCNVVKLNTTRSTHYF